jgi:hypothetical protein
MATRFLFLRSPPSGGHLLESAVPALKAGASENLENYKAQQILTAVSFILSFIQSCRSAPGTRLAIVYGFAALQERLQPG